MSLFLFAILLTEMRIKERIIVRSARHDATRLRSLAALKLQSRARPHRVIPKYRSVDGSANNLAVVARFANVLQLDYIARRIRHAANNTQLICMRGLICISPVHPELHYARGNNTQRRGRVAEWREVGIRGKIILRIQRIRARLELKLFRMFAFYRHDLCRCFLRELRV